jgi:two-component system response regulator CpxR
MARVVLIEDEPDLREILQYNLTQAGHRVQAAATAEAGLRLARESLPDIVLLDLMLPDRPGTTVCTALKREPRTQDIPIIMVTAKGEEVDRIVGLELGADDYLSKPFNPRELVARIRAILRRARGARGVTLEVLDVGRIHLSMGTHKVTVGGAPVALTGAEFRVLEILMRSAGQVLSREALTEQALGRKLVPYDRSIDTHISNLRRKLELQSGTMPELKNVRGAGYMLTWAGPA